MRETDRVARMVRWTWNALAFVLVVQLLLSPFDISRDNTDPRSGSRSGMNLYTDHGTGCEYLGRFWTTLTPRLGADGKHMGCRP